MDAHTSSKMAHDAVVGCGPNLTVARYTVHVVHLVSLRRVHHAVSLLAAQSMVSRYVPVRSVDVMHTYESVGQKLRLMALRLRRSTGH